MSVTVVGSQFLERWGSWSDQRGAMLARKHEGRRCEMISLLILSSWASPQVAIVDRAGGPRAGAPTRPQTKP